MSILTRRPPSVVRTFRQPPLRETRQSSRPVEPFGHGILPDRESELADLRANRDRLAAPPEFYVDVIYRVGPNGENVAVYPERPAPALQPLKRVVAPKSAQKPERLTAPSESDRQWWVENTPTRNEHFLVVGRCPIEPEISDLDAWLEDGCPDLEPEPELTAAGTWR